MLLVITTRSSVLMDHTIKQIDQEPLDQKFDSLTLTADQGVIQYHMIGQGRIQVSGTGDPPPVKI